MRLPFFGRLGRSCAMPYAARLACPYQIPISKGPGMAGSSPYLRFWASLTFFLRFLPA